jgi:hypothetical protein
MRKMIVCLFAAGILCAAAPAFAGEHRDRNDRGGIDVGPLGQCFNPGSADCRANARFGYASGYAYGFAPTHRVERHRRYAR